MLKAKIHEDCEGYVFLRFTSLTLLDYQQSSEFRSPGRTGCILSRFGRVSDRKLNK